MSRKMKWLAMGTLGGTVLQLGGCFNLGGFFGDGFWLDLTRSAVFEFVWDSNAVLDFFGDTAPGLLTP